MQQSRGLGKSEGPLRAGAADVVQVHSCLFHSCGSWERKLNSTVLQEQILLKEPRFTRRVGGNG